MTFNPREEMRKIAESERTIGGPKLTFAEQCAAFAAMYEGAPNRVVRRAFGISAQTASRLAGCLEYDPDPYRTTFNKKTDLVSGREAHDHNGRRNPARFRHYESVGREFEALGAEEFIHRYLTPEMVDRITAARHEGRSENGIKGRRPYDPRRDDPHYQRDLRDKNDRK